MSAVGVISTPDLLMRTIVAPRFSGNWSLASGIPLSLGLDISILRDMKPLSILVTACLAESVSGYWGLSVAVEGAVLYNTLRMNMNVMIHPITRQGGQKVG